MMKQIKYKGNKMKVPYCIVDNKLWVKIPVNNGNVNCTLKITKDVNGKPEPENVFEFYDDFKTDLNKWHGVAPSIIQTNASFGINHAIECKINIPSDSVLVGIGTPNHDLKNVYIYRKDNQIYFKNESNEITKSIKYSDNLKYSIDIEILEHNMLEYYSYTCYIFDNNIHVGSNLHEINVNNYKCNEWCFFIPKPDENIIIDYVLVRKIYNENLNIDVKQITDEILNVNISLKYMWCHEYIQIPILLPMNYNDNLLIEYLEL